VRSHVEIVFPADSDLFIASFLSFLQQEDGIIFPFFFRDVWALWFQIFHVPDPRVFPFFLGISGEYIPFFPSVTLFFVAFYRFAVEPFPPPFPLAFFCSAVVVTDPLSDSNSISPSRVVLCIEWSSPLSPLLFCGTKSPGFAPALASRDAPLDLKHAS